MKEDSKPQPGKGAAFGLLMMGGVLVVSAAGSFVISRELLPRPKGDEFGIAAAIQALLFSWATSLFLALTAGFLYWRKWFLLVTAFLVVLLSVICWLYLLFKY